MFVEEMGSSKGYCSFCLKNGEPEKTYRYYKLSFKLCFIRGALRNLYWGAQIFFSGGGLSTRRGQETLDFLDPCGRGGADTP